MSPEQEALIQQQLIQQQGGGIPTMAQALGGG
jgi:hypothetical protein